MMRLEGQIADLTTDPAFQNGDYTSPRRTAGPYFPINDARYEKAFIPHVTFMPIPSFWGHTAGAVSNPADGKVLNENIGKFLAAGN